MSIMSALGQQEVLTPILLRSNTPAPNEKVLKYLEGMSREEQEDPPRSILDDEEYRSRHSVRTPSVLSPLPLPKAPPLSYTNGHSHHGHDDGDASSNVQDGVRSEMGESVSPLREPGPNDPPGPKYESYDSGPSFGNMGPLPSEDMPDKTNGHTPSWGATRVPLPETEISSRVTTVDPARAASPRASRAGKEGPWSPMTGRTKGTAYPPLPESAVGDGESQFPNTPKARSYARSKAPSISPSDSPSNPNRYSRKRASKADPPGTAEQTPRAGLRMHLLNGNGRSQAPTSVISGSHHSRPFSPFRQGPTTEDLLHAAIRGRAMAIMEESEKSPSVVEPTPSASLHSKAPTQISKAPSQISQVPSQINKVPSHVGKAPTQASKPPTQISMAPSHISKAPSHISKVPSQSEGKNPPSPQRSYNAPSVVASNLSHSRSHQPPPPPSAGPAEEGEGDATPRPPSPNELDQEEARIVWDALAGRTPRTSCYDQPLGPDVVDHFHDNELCVLMQQERDLNTHDVVRKAMRKAIVQRVKKLGLKYDTESIKMYKRLYHDRNPSLQTSEDPPQWAADIKRELVLMQQRIESLGPKIEELRSPIRSAPDNSRYAFEGDESTRTPMTQTVNIQTQPADSMYIGAQSEVVIDDSDHHHHHHYHDDEDYETQGETRTLNRSQYALSEPRDDSGGQQILEEEFFKLRERKHGSQSGHTHQTWEVRREDHPDDEDEDEDEEGHGAPSGMPTIPDGEVDPDRSLPPLPVEDEDGSGDGRHEDDLPHDHWDVVGHHEGSQVSTEGMQLTSWQRVHARLLSWAVIWPMSEFDQALNSTTRGQQVDEVALSIWATQTYKRYVRARLTDNPPKLVDRLFVPPNMADAISSAAFNGQHGNACGMLRDMWAPFGMPGMPRLLIVLAKHLSEPDHWVVHRYSLPDGTLVTYDSYSGRTLMDGRPLGWWFAIRLAWPSPNYPSPKKIEQKMVRLHRPLQLPIDNAVAAAGIWRNILMGSRGERSLDLERLRDLINTEVKNLRQRKLLGRLSVVPTRHPWENLN